MTCALMPWAFDSSARQLEQLLFAPRDQHDVVLVLREELREFETESG